MGAHMDDCCDICGDKGVPEAIAICSRCKVSREHAYCMRICQSEPPEDWCCDHCEHKNVMTTSVETEGFSKASSSGPLAKLQCDLARANKNLDLRRKRSIDREKKIQTGKVKSLSPEEVIMLSSGSKNSASPIRLSYLPNAACPKSKKSDLEKTRLKSRITNPSSSSRPVRSNPCLWPLKQANPSRPNTSQINAAPKQLSIKELRGNIPLQSPAKEYKQEDFFQQKQSRNAPEDIASSKLVAPRVEEHALKAPCGESSAKDGQPVSNSGGAPLLDAELHADHPSASTRSIPSSVGGCPYGPTPNHSWRGSFRVVDNLKFEEDEIQAHHPSIVRRKVYEFSKQMPAVLSFELVDRGDIWVKLFPDYSPDQKDIGLYFFPSTGKRSHNYISMLEWIQEKNMGLRMVMDGAELLVFSSKLLCLDCQRWEGKSFLWGLFFCEKEAKAAGPLTLYEVHKDDNDQVAVDMEIDMLGGLDVGVKDIVLARKHMLQPVPSAMNEIDDDDIPPGFERKHKLRFQTPVDKDCGGGNCVKVELPH